MSYRINKEDVVDIIVFFIIYAFLLSYFTPDVMLSASTTTGGDMGSHYAISQYMHDYLLPHGKLIGWYPHWMAGIPMLQFYFIPPYLLIVLLSYLIPMQIAFKLVTILGIFILPPCAYLSFRLFGFRFPAPSIAASMTLPFLFMESYSFYGGNIKSTLAGQFPHGISFALTFLSIALIFYGMKRNKYLAANSVLLSLAVLTHVYTTIVLAATFVLFFIEAMVRKRFDEIKYLVAVGVITSLLVSFWIVPLFSKFSFTAAPKDFFSGGLSDAFISDFLIFYVLALVGIFFPLIRNLFNYVVYSILEVKPKKRANTAVRKSQIKAAAEPEENPDLQGSVVNTSESMSPLYYYLASAALFYALMDNQILLRIRFLPQLYFLPLMFAALGIYYLTRWLKASFIVPIITVLFIAIWISTGFVGYLPGFGLEESPYLSHGLRDVPGWIEWNYRGLEAKPGWETLNELYKYMATLDPSGRINVEYSTDYNSPYGTPRVFEASPIFTNRSVMEGLLLESSVTYPFLYYLNKEVSHDSWWPGFPIKEPRINLSRGADDLRLYNVKYYVVGSDKIKNLIKEEEKYSLLKTIGHFEIYSLNADSQFIEPLKKEPVLVVTDDWKKFSYQWMVSGDKEVPLVYVRDYGEYESKHFRIVVLDKQVAVPQTGGIKVFSRDELSLAVNSSAYLPECHVSMKRIAEEEFTAETDCIDRPVYFKTSYFPNWMADGGGKMYLTSPSVMMFFPEEQSIRLYYGATAADHIGELLTALGMIIVIYLVLLNNKSFKTNVHSRLMPSSVSRHAQAPLHAAKKAQTKTRDAFSILSEKKYLIMIILFIAVAAYALSTHLSESSKCSSFCSAQGLPKSSQSFFGFGDVVDAYHLGSSHGGDNENHNLVCQATCDESRTEQVYVSHGYVEFDMKVKPGVENTLALELLDNTNCRSTALYVDGIFVRNITGEGIYNWHLYEYSLPEGPASKDKIRVRLQKNDDECYGFDLRYASVKTPACKCSQ